MRALVALVLVIALTGCIKPAPPDEADAHRGPLAPPSAGAVAPGGPQTGALSVVALFADRTPLAGVNVTVANDSQLTDATGLARFPALAAGTYTLLATKTAHRAAQQEIAIVAGQESHAEVVLAAEDGGQHAHKLGFASHTDVYAFQGHFDCSATYVIIPGDCLILVENATNQAGLPDPVSNATSERNVIDFPLDVNWSALVVEMTWDASTAPASDGMTLALEPAEAPVDGHSAKYARVDGSSPLRIDLAPGVQHPSATEKDMPNAAGGEVIRARAFVRGFGHHPAGTDFLGVGVAKDFDFTLYVSVFYGEPAPEGYSAIHAR
ncbi:MAG TPA: carboxypeptidase-like regulatory domain-containing protein [Candidatus Thermoplasmatota archaeon]|nr:carboxypeptidase-like regulatory domain-containing protein [Candidatus Thermoplasmatota archaeon]